MAYIAAAGLLFTNLAEQGAPVMAALPGVPQIGVGLSAFALAAVAAAGLRAMIRRSAKREAWEIIVEDRKEARARQTMPSTTYSDTRARQFAAP